jgi:predicted MFS family arabinose efflux permease
VGFFVAFALILLIRRDLDAGREDHGREPAGRMMKEGLDAIWQTPRVRAYTWVSIGWNLGAAMSAALIVPLLRDALGLSSLQAGLVLGVGAAMGLIVPVFLGRLVAARGPGDVTAGLTLLSVGSILATAAAPGFLTVLVSNAVRSFSDFGILSTVIGERQKGVPDRLQARVGITGRMIAVCAIAGGGLIGSVLADVVGVRGVFVISGLLVGVAIVLTIPRVRGLDRPDREPTVEL